jgi:hypothetical protein
MCEAGCTRWGMPDSLVLKTVSNYPNLRILGNYLVGVGSVGNYLVGVGSCQSTMVCKMDPTGRFILICKALWTLLHGSLMHTFNPLCVFK